MMQINQGIQNKSGFKGRYIGSFISNIAIYHSRVLDIYLTDIMAYCILLWDTTSF
jgi:hypothetical protein